MLIRLLSHAITCSRQQGDVSPGVTTGRPSECACVRLYMGVNVSVVVGGAGDRGRLVCVGA